MSVCAVMDSDHAVVQWTPNHGFSMKVELFLNKNTPDFYFCDGIC